MDWTRAKSILIIALLITNLVIGGSIVYQNIVEAEAKKTFLNNTLDILEQKNIHIECEIPDDRVKMPVLSVEYDDLDQTILRGQLSLMEALPESSRSEKDIVALANKALEKSGIMTDNVEYDRIEESDGKTTVYYVNKIDGVLIEDSYIQCVVEDGKAVDIKRLWLEPVELGKNKKEVIPIAEALIRLMHDNQEFDEIRVEEIELVFWLDTSSLDLGSAISDTAFPAWKITYNNGRIKHITAFRQ